MPEVPGLSEILNSADAERGTGTPAVVYDNRDLIHQLNQSAQYKAEGDWRKYNLFLNNLKDVYKDLNTVAQQPIMTEDREKLTTEMASIFKEIQQDPKSYFGGGAKFHEIQGRLSKLQSDATESKQNSLFDTAHRNFFYRNPELDNDENKSLIDNYRKQPLGSRQPYMLGLPGLFDPEEMAKGINGLVKTDWADSKITPDNQFIQSETGTRYDPVKYKRIVEAMYDQPDKRGIPLAKTIGERYNKLPDYVKAQYATQKDPVKAYYIDLMERYRMPDQSKKDELKPNPGYLEAQKLAEQRKYHAQQIAVDWAKVGIDRDKLNKTDSEDIIGADSVLNEAISIIQKGEKAAPEGWGKRGSKPDMYTIADPTLLQSFGRIDKDGRYYNVPDEVEYNKRTGQLNLLYKSETDNTGKETLLETPKRIPLDERTWLKQITKRSFPNKDIGGVNSLVEQILTKNKNSLYELSKNYNTNNKPSSKIDIKWKYYPDYDKWVPASENPEDYGIPKGEKKYEELSELGKDKKTSSSQYKAKMPDGTLIYSNDGKTWVDKDGNKID